MQAGIGTGSHGGHGGRLGEDLRVGSNAHFQILTPGTLGDQHLLEGHGLRRAGFQFGEVVSDQRHDFLTDGCSGCRVATCPLFDNTLKHRDGKRDPGGLDDLQVNRGQQPGACRVAGIGRGVV